MAYAGVLYFPMCRQKKSGSQPFIKFSGFVGLHKGGHNDTILRGFDDGILRGRWNKIFWPSISPPLEVTEYWNFSAWQRLTIPMPRQNISP